MEQIDLQKAVYNEQDLLGLLGIDRKKLDYLRLEKEFPCVYLTRRSRVYLADEVFQWLKKMAAV